ncbi:phage protease [Alkalilimnicola sp. S0819]|uniref:phage protease n=1 Tax=Alkalilimnicola sp. S0819 TaxID=2613922 RepID=UPI00126234A3|nr:phage protease [Alkalilimnicola sp. S0819]KAB7624329.1 hypothetical protein F3N43_05845 [Alkalilimnicola sp. S0819]MPQ16154.1 hypothetical protein [Alkalilimnicola sp. S0819]
MDHTLLTALNQADATAGRIALNAELPTDGGAPEWVELIPAGRDVVGRDGRRWVKDQPERLVATFNASGAALPIDWEHASEHKAPKGEPAPAAGWIEELELRDGDALWGRVEWTEAARNQIERKHYRYLSPVFLFEPATRRIATLSSAGLTNRPNLFLTALNQGLNDLSHPQKEAATMVLPEAIRKALRLADDATESDAVSAINSMQGSLQTARNQAEQPPLEKFVPRADHDAALSRATNAEQQLQQHLQQAQEREIETAINQALEAGKITPATAEYHKAACRQDGGLDAFKQYVAAAPVVAADSGLDGKQPDQEKALNSETSQVAAMFGNSADDIREYSQAGGN